METKGKMGFMRYLMAAVVVLLAANQSAAVNTEELIKNGDQLYEGRQAGRNGDWASTEPIGKALKSYMDAYNAGDHSPELVVKILRATYFYSTYAEKEAKKQKEALQKAVEIGDEALKANPDNAGLNYQLGGCWGRWGEVNGILASARQGVADRIKGYAEKLVKVDPAYGDAGGYRTLGRLHYKAPKIPFILPWPSKKESVEYLAKAVEMGPGNLTNRLFYAESLMNEKRYEEAGKQVSIILGAALDEARAVEILRDKKEAEVLKKQIEDKTGTKLAKAGGEKNE